jgi:hypothetical protein
MSNSNAWAVDSMPAYIILILGIGVIVLFFGIFTVAYADDQYALPEQLELVVVQQRFTGTCFSQNGVQNGVIDLNKFTQQQLAYCYNAPDSFYSFRLTLDGKTITTSNWKGGAVQRTEEKSVSIIKNNAVTTSLMKIEVRDE